MECRGWSEVRSLFSSLEVMWILFKSRKVMKTEKTSPDNQAIASNT